MILRETMRCRKVKRIFPFHVSNKLLSPEIFAHHILLLFYPLRYEKEILSGFPPIYQKGGKDVKNISKMKVQPYGDLVDQAFLKFSENIINNQDPQSEIENHETPGTEYLNKNVSEEIDTIEPSATPNFMLKISPGNETAEGIISLNSKQSLECSYIGPRLCLK